jgi:hypothetical protein
MATRDSLLDGRGVASFGPLVATLCGCTIVLMTALLGGVALAAGRAGGFVARLPMYVLVTAVAFLAVLLVADHARTHGTAILARAAGVAVVGFATVSLGTEGVVDAVRYTDTVVYSSLFVYLLSTAVVVTGVGYWATHNYRDVRNLAASDSL